MNFIPVTDFLTNLSDRTPDFIWNTSIILFSIIVGIIIKNILVPAIKKYSSAGQDYSLVRSVVRHFKLTFTFFIPLLILNALLPLMKLGLNTYEVFQKILEIALTICFAIIIIRIIRII